MKHTNTEIPQNLNPHSGQVVFITGAAGTIGSAIARRFAQQGAKLALMDKVELNQLQALEAELKAQGASHVISIQGDLSNTERHAEWVQKIVQEMGPIHCLINNAGMGALRRADMLELTPEAFDVVMNVNLKGTFFLTQKVMAHMLTQQEVSHPRAIITVSSISVDVASVERVEYCMSKSALGMLTKLVALRLAAANIPAFDLRPGITHSGMTKPVEARYDKLIAEGLVPIGRWGEGEDMANIALSLASGNFAFATGTVIQADGGLTIPSL
ncbi:3-ketoacyl-ACP reductase [Paenalcaligenes hominis]|uniref:3-ketoacyl-ACP reductase n=1 Tax=Paenalcaligenes hominis TaxID=643674 RepID=UPI003524EE1C